MGGEQVEYDKLSSCMRRLTFRWGMHRQVGHRMDLISKNYCFYLVFEI